MAGLLLFMPASLQAVDKWVSQDQVGNGDASSASNAAAYSLATVNGWLSGTTDTTVHFLYGNGGEYLI